MGNFCEQLSNAATEAPERGAVRLDDLILSYGELEAAVAQAAGWMRAQGVGAGDRVAIQLPNVLWFPVVYYAALRLGAVGVPLNPLLTGHEVAYQLADSGARLMIGWQGCAESARAGCAQAQVEHVLLGADVDSDRAALADGTRVEDVTEREDGDPAVIIYTSGTTGSPKGAVLTHGNLRAAAAVGRELIDGGPGDVALAALPLFHVFGMNSIMNTTLLARGLMTLVPRFEPAAVLEVMQRDRVTAFGGVPTMYAALLHHPDRHRYDHGSLRICVSGGAALPVEVLRGFEAAFEAQILEGYGMSETTGMASFNVRDRERKPGSIGVPVGGTEVRLVDDDDRDVDPGEPGELLMRGPFVMSGYWNRESATAETMRGGWLHSGDIATVDDDGYLFIVDRKKDLIIRGGYNVYPREVEEVLYAHPAVRDAAVVPVPDDRLGEEVGAAIVLVDGADTTPEELREYVKSRVAAYKYPRIVWLTDALPTGPTGKILKRAIEIPESVRGPNVVSPSRLIQPPIQGADADGPGRHRRT